MNSQNTVVSVFLIDRRETRARYERRACRPWQLAIVSRTFAGCAVLVFGILICATPAAAGDVFESVSTLIGSGPGGASQMNVNDSTLTPIKSEAINGDVAFSSTVLHGDVLGSATLNEHACSEPSLGFFLGTAAAGGSFDFGDSYRITSSTLPVGAPVFITLVANAALRETLKLNIGQGGEFSGDGVLTTGDANINFAISGASYPFSGAFTQSNNFNDGESTSKQGLFSGSDFQQMSSVVNGMLEKNVVQVLVGDILTVGVGGESRVNSGAAIGVVADVDVQVVLNWGVHPFDSDIQIVSLTDGQPAPDNSDQTLDMVIAGLPPRPETVVPEPSSIVMLNIGLIGLLTFFHRRKSAKLFG
jgi:hypothetical protein